MLFARRIPESDGTSKAKQPVGQWVRVMKTERYPNDDKPGAGMLVHLEDGSIEFINVLELKEFTETWPDDQTDLLDQDQLLPGLIAHLNFYNSFIDDWEDFQAMTGRV